MTKNDSQFAKDVAKQLDRRRMRRRLFMIGMFVAAIALAITYLTCGRGWGVGGAGKGEGSGPGSGSGRAVEKAPPRCAIRVTGAGILLDGKPATRQEAVAMCKTMAGADVVVTGDARQGDWDELRAALEAANIPVFTKR
jgi:hypothetical protein